MRIIGFWIAPMKFILTVLFCGWTGAPSAQTAGIIHQIEVNDWNLLFLSVKKCFYDSFCRARI